MTTNRERKADFLLVEKDNENHFFDGVGLFILFSICLFETYAG